MALRLLRLALKQQIPKNWQIGSVASVFTLERIGKREIVGHGWNGTACYADRVDYPMPGVRFREPNDEINALIEKEKCDWKELTGDEVKSLYRYSFCQTLAEMKAPTGEWKYHLGVALLFSSLGVWICILMNLFVFEELPETFEEHRRVAQLKRMLDLEINIVDGLSSKWDYENEKWK